MKRDPLGLKKHAPRPAGGPGLWQDADDLRWAVRDWAVRMGVRPPPVQLRAMRTKWASVSTAGRLTINTELLALPRPLGEFVIVHELAHLLAPNHGKLFKSYMHAYLPDWEARDLELRAHAMRTGAD